MGIKDIKPLINSPYKQSYYKLINESKYVGPRPIICRSGWERNFAKYCDINPNIIKWSSEPFSIKYFNIWDHRYHDYYPDFYIKILKNNVYKEYIVEIKPSSHLKRPILPKTKSYKAIKNYNLALKRYITNYCKIETLKKLAKNKNYEVLLITEKSFII